MEQSIDLICEAGPWASSGWKRNPFAKKPTEEAKTRLGKKWRLLLGLDELRLLDERGDDVIAVPSRTAEGIVLLPGSATETGSAAANLGMRIDGETYWFRPDRQAVRTIKTYFDIVILMQGERAYARALAWERGKFILGLLALPGSIALTAGIMAASIWAGAKFGIFQPVIAGGVLVAGFACFANGVLGLLRSRRLRRLHDQLDRMKLE